MVTTTVRMLYRVHTHTSQLRLIYTTSSSYQTNHSTVSRAYNLLGARWKLDSCFCCIRIVRHHCAEVTTGTTNLTTVSWQCLKVAHYSSLRHLSYW